MCTYFNVHKSGEKSLDFNEIYSFKEKIQRKLFVLIFM